MLAALETGVEEVEEEAKVERAAVLQWELAEGVAMAAKVAIAPLAAQAREGKVEMVEMAESRVEAPGEAERAVIVEIPATVETTISTVDSV